MSIDKCIDVLLHSPTVLFIKVKKKLVTQMVKLSLLLD